MSDSSVLYLKSIVEGDRKMAAYEAIHNALKKWGARVKRVSILGKNVVVEGTWNFAGKWSDYALDAGVDSDQGDDLDVAGMDHVMGAMEAAIKTAVAGMKYQVVDFYVDDGEFRVELGKGVN